MAQVSDPRIEVKSPAPATAAPVAPESVLAPVGAPVAAKPDVESKKDFSLEKSALKKFKELLLLHTTHLMSDDVALIKGKESNKTLQHYEDEQKNVSREGEAEHLYQIKYNIQYIPPTSLGSGIDSLKDALRSKNLFSDGDKHPGYNDVEKMKVRELYDKINQIHDEVTNKDDEINNLNSSEEVKNICIFLVNKAYELKNIKSRLLTIIEMIVTKFGLLDRFKAYTVTAPGRVAAASSQAAERVRTSASTIHMPDIKLPSMPSMPELPSWEETKASLRSGGSALWDFIKTYGLLAFFMFSILGTFIGFSLIGNKMVVFDSYNQQNHDYYSKGAIFYGMLSGIFFLYYLIIVIVMKTSTFTDTFSRMHKGYLGTTSIYTADNSGIFRYKVLKDMRSIYLAITGILLIIVSYYTSMIMAYTNMGLDTENIPHWNFAVTSALVVLSLGLLMIVEVTVRAFVKEPQVVPAAAPAPAAAAAPLTEVSSPVPSFSSA